MILYNSIGIYFNHFDRRFYMNDFIKKAAIQMTENYMNCDFLPKEQDKIMPDEKTIEKI